MVLAIDDENKMKFLWADIEAEVLPVRHVLSVDESIPLLESEEYRLIIIDRMMDGEHTFPNASEIDVGILLYKKIRQTNPAIPVIILTGYYEGDLGLGMEEVDSRFRMLEKSDTTDDIIFAIKALLHAVYGDEFPL